VALGDGERAGLQARPEIVFLQDRAQRLGM